MDAPRSSLGRLQRACFFGDSLRAGGGRGLTEKQRTLGFLTLAVTTGMSLWFMTAAILPDLAAEAGLEASELTALSSAVQAGFVAGALFIAVSGLADRLDPRKVCAVASLGTAGATAMLLVVPLDGPGAVALRFLAGALMAGVYPVGMKIAVGWGLKDRGFLVGLLVGALTLGKSLPYGVAWLGGGNWRLTLVVSCLIAAAGALTVLLTRLGPHHRKATGFRPSAIAEAWRNPGCRAAYLGYFGHMWELFVFWAWVGAAATASYALRLGEDEAVSLGKLTAFVAIAAGAPACVLAGRIADRVGKAEVASLAMVASGGLAVVTALAFGGPVWLVFALFVLWGIAVIPDSAQFSALVADHAPPEWAGTLMSFQTALGFLLTVVTVQTAPWVAAAFGWPVLLAGLAVGPVLSVIAMRPLLRGY